MKFEPQCKTQADLHREWARVLDMCEGTEARPEDGWRLTSPYASGCPNVAPSFIHNPEQYELSIGIVEGKHVFRGDTLYFRGQPVIANTTTCNFNNKFTNEFWSWNPPKQEPIIPEGFTKWEGGEWTGHPKDEVTVLFRDGIVCSGIAQTSTHWNHCGASKDIIAYKITKKFEPETVMVEVKIDYAKWCARRSKFMSIDESFDEACRKALERENLL